MAADGHRGHRLGARTLGLLALSLVLLPSGGDIASAPKPARILLLGTTGDPTRLEAARRGAAIAIARHGTDEAFPDGVVVDAVAHDPDDKALASAVGKARATKPLGVLALPTGDLGPALWKAAKRIKAPWFVLTGLEPDAHRNPGNVLLLAASPAGQGIVAADGLVAPLAARRVAIVHEPTRLGRVLAAAVSRNLSPRISLAGIRGWHADDKGADVVAALKGMEADWIYVALTGTWATRFAEALVAASWTPQCLFCEGTREESLLAVGGASLARSAFLCAPDPELKGREGEALIEALERDEGPIEMTSVRAFEATRRILLAHRTAGSRKPRAVWAALDAATPHPGVMGKVAFERHGAMRFFPFTWWEIGPVGFREKAPGLLPTIGCGPPLGFGRGRPGPLNEDKGRLGYVTYGEGEVRTIEQDLLRIGLSTDGKDPDLDAFVRDEILARAIRIAHRLFRREADGTPIPGVSWGMTFATTLPEDRPRHKTWLAVVAGDDPAAGGRVTGSGMVAIYSTFLERTMYRSRRLRPPISSADRVLLDGDYRWGIDRTNNRRADEIRCLIDGFSSAVGLTLAHEFGHLCGCDHDTEHPTSIMNVVAGAGASWEEAVWIPAHAKNVTNTLAIETEAP